MIGSYASLASRMAKTIIDGEFDGITLVVPDYVEDLRAVAEKILMRLPEYGVSCRIGQV
jgi:pyrimidine oxygenase